MAFNQFKAALKKAIKLNKPPRIVAYHNNGDTFWIGTGNVVVNCSNFSEAQKTIIRHEASEVANDMREVPDWQYRLKRWVNDQMKPVERTRLHWVDATERTAPVPIQLLTSEHGTCGVQAVYFDVMTQLVDTEFFTIDWGGGKGENTMPLRIKNGDSIVGFISPIVWPNPTTIWSALESVLAGLPVPDEVSE